MGGDDKTLAERAAAGAAALSEAERAQHAAEDAATIAKRKERDEWLRRACTPPSRGLRDLFGRPDPDVDGERAWLGALPFPVRLYEDLFEGSYAFHRCAVLLEFTGADPDQTLLTQLFAAVSTAFTVGTVGTLWERRRPYAEYSMTSELRGSPDRAWHIRLLFHRVADEVLVPLHEEYPLAAIECGRDHHFDMRR
jgi:hypothetical protein